ncbi:hypothetical protein [Nocardia inohanensis]|uniref:hypothetical protein n=1 Tax=Nocardia inohanensis TaxID=209246 RepID=UPI00082BDB36|nr:hypothetical protein [Nocardia inohanensis]
MSSAVESVLSLVVVVNKAQGRLVVWHVNVGRAIGLSRLSGAWVLEAEDGEESATLTAGYRAIECEEGALSGLDIGGVIDLDATVAAVRAEVTAVDEAFTAHQAAVAGKLIRPQWPVIAHPLEARLPLQGITEAIRPVLVAARGIADLADAWSAFESLRTARPFLAEHGGLAVRPLPLVVR